MKGTHVSTGMADSSKITKIFILKVGFSGGFKNFVLHGLCFRCLLKHHPHHDVLGTGTEREREGGRTRMREKQRERER